VCWFRPLTHTSFRLTLQRKYGQLQSFFVPKKIFIFCAKTSIKAPAVQTAWHASDTTGPHVLHLRGERLGSISVIILKSKIFRNFADIIVK